MSAPVTRDIPLDVIDATDRLRPVDPAWAETLAAAMGERGLDQPIVVRPGPDDGAEFVLVAGGHRLAAAMLLGWPTIRAEIRDLDDLQARMVEIDENLIRHELTALDRGLFLLERKRVHEQLHPETAHGGDRKSRTGQEDFKWQTLPLGRRFTAEAAEKVGLGERTVRDAIAMVERLDPRAIRLIRGTDLVDNAVALKSLGELDADDQVRLAGLIANGDARGLKQARILAEMDAPTSRDPEEVLFNKLVELYGRAAKRTKLRFEQHAGLVIRNERGGA